MEKSSARFGNNMSRIGLKPIPVPSGVTVSVAPDNVVTVKGPKGELSQKVHRDMKIEQGEGSLTVARPTDNREHRSQHGLARTLINNMVVGVSEGYERILEIHGVGYRAALEGKSLVLNIGFSHPVKITGTDGVEFEVGQDNRTRMVTVKVKGINKHKVGQFASDIRRVRKPDPYKGKGIRYRGETVKLKQGKRANA